MRIFVSVHLLGLTGVLLGASCSLVTDVSGLVGAASQPESSDGGAGDTDLGRRSGALTLEPISVTLEPGQSIQFLAKTDLRGVLSWTVVEAPLGGQVAASGTYTAPYAAGSFHVVARVGSSTASAVVTVPPSVMLVAGRTDGYVDGRRVDARLRYPSGCVVDRLGNVFVTERNNSVIRRIDATGAVSTFAGTAGAAGATDGIGRAALFNQPAGIAIDVADNLYVADIGNSTVRRITPTGVVSTLAGAAGKYATVDGIGSEARFQNPSGVAVDARGNVYVVDFGSNTIRKISPSAVVSTLAGSPNVAGAADGSGATARFREPTGIAVDAIGNVYVADSANSTIRRITPDGNVSTIAGSPGASGSDNGAGSAARFRYPTGVTVDSTGTVFVADQENRLIRKVTNAGVVSTYAGEESRTQIDGSQGGFLDPHGIALGGDGTLYIAEQAGQAIRTVSRSGDVGTFAGHLIVGDEDGDRTVARFRDIWAIASNASGDIFVGDDAAIRKVKANGEVTTLAGKQHGYGAKDGPGRDARFVSVRGLAFDSAGSLYASDTYNSVVRKVLPNGYVSTHAGRSGVSGAADGTAGTALFQTPTGLGVDPSGNVYVADTSGHTVRVIRPSGEVLTIAGTSGLAGSNDGSGANAKFSYPTGIAIGDDGNVFVADTNNYTIRSLDRFGLVTRVAGTSGVPGYADGNASLFSYPAAAASDLKNGVFIADRSNRAVRHLRSGMGVSTLAGNPAQNFTAVGALPGSLPEVRGVSAQRAGAVLVATPFAIFRIVSE